MSTRPTQSTSHIRQTFFTLLLALGCPSDVLPMLDAASAALMAQVAQLRAPRAGRRWRLVWPLALLVAVQAGCAGSRSAPPRSSFGTVGIASGRFAPEVQLDMPTRQTSAAWAARAALDGAGGDLRAMILVGPFLALAGATVGTILAPRAAVVEPARVVLAHALQDLDATAGLRECLLQLARDRAERTVVQLPGLGPTSAGEVVDYRPLVGQGVGTVLEVAVSRVSIEMAGIKSVRLVVQARGRLVRVVDGVMVQDRAFEYRGRDRVFTAWAESDAAPLRLEADRASRTLAEEIATKFLGAAQPGHRAESAAGDTARCGRRPVGGDAHAWVSVAPQKEEGQEA